MKKKSITASIILFLAATALNALPSHLIGDDEGWLELSIGYTLTFPAGALSDFGHNIRCSAGYNSGNLGGGLSLIIGDPYLNIYGEGHYFFSTEGIENLAIPVYIKIGFIQNDYRNGLGISAESGFKLFFNEQEEIIVQAESASEYYFNSAEITAGADFLLIPLFETPDPAAFQNKRLIISASAVISLDATPRPFSGVYYY